jgi:hypothetical protein
MYVLFTTEDRPSSLKSFALRVISCGWRESYDVYDESRGNVLEGLTPTLPDPSFSSWAT